MKTMQSALILAGLCLSANGFAAQPTDVEKAKQDALNTCLAKATAHYGSAIASSKPKKKKVGKMRGYAVTLKVGKAKKMRCLADANGKTIFFK